MFSDPYLYGQHTVHLSHFTVDNFYKLDKFHGLPLISLPAHEWTTLTTALHHLNQLIRADDKSILSFLDHWFLTISLQAWTVLCVCLAATVEWPGYEDWPLTVVQILNGKLQIKTEHCMHITKSTCRLKHFSMKTLLHTKYVCHQWKQ